MRKMMRAEIWTIVQTGEGNAVLLRAPKENIAVPIFIGQLEAQSMLIGMEEHGLPRPMTHDLILSLLEGQGLALERVEISELRESVFYARLVIAGASADGSPLILDSRPSDALCLATRRKCPILVSDEVAALAGIPVDFFVEALGGAARSGSRGVGAMGGAGSGADGEAEADFATRRKCPQEGKRRRLMEQLAQAVEEEEYEQAAKIRDAIKAMESAERPDFNNYPS